MEGGSLVDVWQTIERRSRHTVILSVRSDFVRGRWIPIHQEHIQRRVSEGSCVDVDFCALLGLDGQANITKAGFSTGPNTPASKSVRPIPIPRQLKAPIQSRDKESLFPEEKGTLTLRRVVLSLDLAGFWDNLGRAVATHQERLAGLDLLLDVSVRDEDAIECCPLPTRWTSH
jgi:hypothetical protein